MLFKQEVYEHQKDLSSFLILDTFSVFVSSTLFLILPCRMLYPPFYISSSKIVFVYPKGEVRKFKFVL